jgi:glycosyltransferase involved in cell wall biosynthesis
MIDGRNLNLEKGTGVATYARNLSYCLRDIGYEVDVLYGNKTAHGQSDLIKEISFFDSNDESGPRWLKKLRSTKESLSGTLGYQATKVPITGSVIVDTFKSKLPYYDSIYNSPDLFRKSHNSFGLSKKIRKVNMQEKPDLMHWTYPLPLKISNIPNIYTLHDLVPLRLPYTTLDNKRKYLRLVEKIASSADHIVTVSESSKNDIMKILGVSPERITNTYQSVSIPEIYANKSEDLVQTEVESTFGLEYKNYFIFWGSIEPKKNIGRIIESYLSSGVKTPLVIVGAMAWKSENEVNLLNSYITNKGDKVIQLKYVPFPLLVSLIKGAKATLFPSLYEGFGLPVLESMLLGTPVISSNTASIPEVAGDAAILVDPYDTRSIADAIHKIDDDSDLREDLIKKGFSQARLFSRSEYMKKISLVYEKFI